MANEAAPILLPPCDDPLRGGHPAAYPRELKPAWEPDSKPPLHHMNFLADTLDDIGGSLRAQRKVFVDLHEKILLQA